MNLSPALKRRRHYLHCIYSLIGSSESQFIRLAEIDISCIHKTVYKHQLLFLDLPIQFWSESSTRKYASAPRYFPLGSPIVGCKSLSSLTIFWKQLQTKRTIRPLKIVEVDFLRRDLFQLKFITKTFIIDLLSSAQLIPFTSNQVPLIEK